MDNLWKYWTHYHHRPFYFYKDFVIKSLGIKNRLMAVLTGHWSQSMQKSFREVMVLWYFSEDNSLMATCKEGGPPMQLQRRGPNSPSPNSGLALRNFKSWPYYCQRNKYCACIWYVEDLLLLLLFIVHHFPIKAATFLLYKLTPINQNGLLSY